MAMMKAPSDIRCSVVPNDESIGNDSKTVRINPMPIISPARHPMAIISTNEALKRHQLIGVDTRKHDIASETIDKHKKQGDTKPPAQILHAPDIFNCFSKSHYEALFCGCRSSGSLDGLLGFL